MTFAEKAKKMLVDKGMFESQADKVVELMKSNPANVAMADRWDDGVDGYPPAMVTILWAMVKIDALAFIDRECPKAWFRDMFVWTTPSTKLSE